MSIYVFLVVSLLTVMAQRADDTWEQKIIPLKSDRLAVEKLLGKSKEKNCNDCTYDTPTNTVTVSYAVERCQGALPGWNVAAGTVLSFSLKSNYPVPFETPKLQTDGLITFATDDLTRYYVDAEKGLEYTVGRFRELISISHLPLESDNRLRCEGFPRYDVAGSTYKPFENFIGTSVEEGRARILNNLISLRQANLNLKLFVIAYYGDDFPKKKFDNYLVKLRKALKNELSESSGTIKIIDGGRRKQFQVDLFFVKNNYPPPTPAPEFPR